MQYVPHQQRIERGVEKHGAVVWRSPRRAAEDRRRRIMRHDSARQMLGAR